MKTLIIGCGIAGPVTAMALREVGIEAEIFEAYEQGAENVGSFLNLPSNGLAALSVIGAHHQVLAEGIPTPRMVMWSGSGRRLGEVANGLRLDDGTVSHTDLVRRGDIGAALPVYDLPPVPVWHRGRVLLTGDAAHATSPSSGQGASLAVEDAIVLARCLRDGSGHEEAFRRFEAERRPRAERVVAYSRTISNSKAAGPVARVFRDLMMPIFLKKSASQESLAWMYRYQPSL